MGEYFDTVTKPRIKKVIYSKDWKDGKPISREGISQIFKYIKLEQYEDTLNNLVINKPQAKSLFNDKKFEEDYIINYMMNFETKDSPSLLNIDMFDNPFEYKMKIIEKDEVKLKNIDLIETFNYLIGLEVIRTEKTRYFKYEEGKLKEQKDGVFKIKEIIGKTRDGEKILIIWRNRTADKALDNKVVEEYFRKQRYNPLDMEFDKIYINGDNTLQNIRQNEEHWKVELTEEKFKKMMFEENTL
jgi:adenine-specific DNA-methyltransferase